MDKRHSAAVQSVAAAFGAIVAWHGGTASATHITATTSFEFEVIVQRTIGQAFSHSYKSVSDKSPETVVVGSNAGVWGTRFDDRFISYSLKDWITEVKLTDPGVGHFGDITTSYATMLRFANPTDAPVTFGVTPNWTALMSISSDINPEDLSDAIDIHAVSAYTITVRDQDRNVPAPWVDVVDAIRFGDDDYRKSGATGIIFTVPARDDTRFLSFSIFTGSLVTVIPGPSTLMLALLGLCILAGICRKRLVSS